MRSNLTTNRILIVLTLLIITIFSGCKLITRRPVISIVTDKTQGTPVLHGITKLKETLDAKKIRYEQVASVSDARSNLIILAGLSKGDGEAAVMLNSENHQVPETPEALTVYKKTSNDNTIWIIGGYDDRGLMYGLLDVATRIGWSSDKVNPMSEVIEVTEKPDVSERAVSLYTMNRAYWESRFYDTEYWKKYLDLLAENRFNSMVLIFGYENGGFLAPCYPYFFDVEEFSDVKMVGITPQQQQQNLEAMNQLINMAHERGIRFTVGIWDHIYRGGVQGGGIPGAEKTPDKPVPGLVWGLNSDNLISYTKTALTKFIKMVPELDAIQFRMHNESGLKKEEQVVFWSDVFKMMKQTSPDLRLDLRAKELPDAVVRSAIDEGIKFRITTKFWMEQMGMPYHTTQINPEKSPRRQSYGDMLKYPQEYKMHWRLWSGGTTRILLWGSPEYVSRFAESTHLYDGDGYEVNEPLATKMEAQPHDAKPFNLLNQQYRYYDYEFERYWHFFQVFGRIGYNPKTAPEIWQKEFEKRFGSQAAPYIEEAIHKASWVLPRIIASSYPYSGFPTTRGWAEKQRLGNLDQFAASSGSDIQQFANFDEEAQILIEGGETAKLLPSMTSKWFGLTSDTIDSLIIEAEKVTDNKDGKEFISTITDLKILSGLARYHSERIPAAVSYRLYERTKDITALDAAIGYERSAIDAWRKIVDAAGDVYTDDLMMGVRDIVYGGINYQMCGHWRDELAELEKGLSELEQKRAKLNSLSTSGSSPSYKEAARPDNSKLFQILHQPVITLPAGEPLKITINVTAGSGIKWVSLSYRNVNQDIDYKTLPMKQTGEVDTYEAIVPADQINPKWDFMYFIKIMDKEGNGIIHPNFSIETPYVIVKLIR